MKKKLKELIEKIRAALAASPETSPAIIEPVNELIALVEPKQSERKKRAARTKLAKLANDAKVKLHRVDASAKSTTLRILKLWAQMPEATTSALELSSSPDFDQVAHPLDWARHVIRQAIARGDAEILGVITGDKPAPETTDVVADAPAAQIGDTEFVTEASMD